MEWLNDPASWLAWFDSTRTLPGRQTLLGPVSDSVPRFGSKVKKMVSLLSDSALTGMQGFRGLIVLRFLFRGELPLRSSAVNRHEHPGMTW